MKPLTAKQVETELRQHGFTLDRTRGSHRVWIKEDEGKSIVVPNHGGKILGQGLLLAIFRQAGIPRPER